MTQLSLLFDPPCPRSEARRAIGRHLVGLRATVLAFIRDRGQAGATDPEIAAGLGMQSDTARARRCELRDLGMIRDSGLRRPTPSGRPSTVWVECTITDRSF